MGSEIDRGTVSFFEALNEDTALRGELASAVSGAAVPLDAVEAFARSKGYAVDRATLEAAHRALAAKGELDDRELDAVAGGFNPQPEPPGYDWNAVTTNFDQQIFSGW